MNDSIYTIPISEVFEPKRGCPFCRMHDTLEARAVDYILGAAMMEPDIRIETNRKGFCKTHYDQMISGRNRLALALMLSSHLAEIRANIFEKKTFLVRDKKVKKAQSLTNSCYICDKIDAAMEKMIDTALRLHAESRDFRALYAAQETLCVPHFVKICTLAQERLSKRAAKELVDASAEIAGRYLDTLQEDVSHFCNMFDYRNSGEDADWGNARDSIERAVWFLTSRPCE